MSMHACTPAMRGFETLAATSNRHGSVTVLKVRVLLISFKRRCIVWVALRCSGDSTAASGSQTPTAMEFSFIGSDGFLEGSRPQQGVHRHGARRKGAAEDGFAVRLQPAVTTLYEPNDSLRALQQHEAL